MELAILAVTKRYGGVCIAGIDKTLKWIRPTKEKELNLEDIHLSNGNYISIGKVYNFNFTKHSPVECQTENYIINEDEKILNFKTLTESQRQKLFSRLSENSLVTSNPSLDIAQILKNRNRSLILLGPVNIESVSILMNPRINSKLDSIQIKGQNNVINLPCTDLKFRAFAKNLLKKRNENSLTLNGSEFKDLIKYDQIFLAIGLTLKHKTGGGLEDNWPMIIGVHTIPDYEQEVDYNAI